MQVSETENISPECRRLVIAFAAKESIDYRTAQECLIIEGVKSLCTPDAGHCPVVFRSVEKRV